MYCKSIELCEVAVLKFTVLVTAKYIIVYGLFLDVIVFCVCRISLDSVAYSNHLEE